MAHPVVRFGESPSDLLQEFLAEGGFTRVGVLVDRNTARFCYPEIQSALPSHHLLVVEPGEEQKNLDTCIGIWRELTAHQFDRHSILIILGGGVLGDMGGFCAATFKRGISFAIVPTTLLAQVDASVGGKLAVDFDDYKNHIGIFQEPKATLISPHFLKTLPERELRSGFAEVIKHCLIGDRKMWDVIRAKGLQDQDWISLIPHSVGIKSGVVDRDPREKGERKTLNFGHTIGHAIESLSLSRGERLFHGEAIAAGMILESEIAVRKGLLDTVDQREINHYLCSVFGKIALPTVGSAWSAMQQDKKNIGNKVLMALPNKIGKAIWDVEVSEEEVKKAWLDYDSI